ncbi:hypothetical protein Cgig2_023528 [Carnegiea gigantea]|uniref:Uncharacterized protein n=1 Tax=Carnegiea gigantea TaxID=171969 RepID=A0A9Q1GRN8_9CARY|nr:hypothetical protein Cgig2_023528 [Carnegiea gigantea]
MARLTVPQHKVTYSTRHLSPQSPHHQYRSRRGFYFVAVSRSCAQARAYLCTKETKPMLHGLGVWIRVRQGSHVFSVECRVHNKGTAGRNGIRLPLETLVMPSPSPCLHSPASLPQQRQSLLTVAPPLSPTMAGFDVEDGSTPTTPHAVSLQLGLPTSTVASTPVVSSAFSPPPPPPLSSAPVGSFLSAGVPAPVLSGIFSRWVSRVGACCSEHSSWVVLHSRTLCYHFPRSTATAGFCY